MDNKKILQKNIIGNKLIYEMEELFNKKYNIRGWR